VWVYRLIHIATHTRLDDARPDLSGIVFSLVDRTGAATDGFLRLHDVYGLRLQADLVVLSACDTALGAHIRGEGVLSLARGFFHAGVPRVIASLWKVDDEATASLMRMFYRTLLSTPTMSPAAALRSAQLTIRAQPRWRAPHYWAGFVLQGVW
jgi:CHAT domain-containing protein